MWGVVVEADGTIKYPYPGGAVKHRKGLEKDDAGGRKFWWSPPTMAGQVPFLPPNFEPSTHMFLLEGETDSLAAWQMAPPAAQKGIVGLSGLNAWKDRYAEELFGKAKVVWVVLDNDDPYSPAKSQGDEAWRRIKGALGRKAKRVVLPQGVADVAEFAKLYDWSAFRVLLDAANQPRRVYPRLDLTKPVPDTDWLVEDLFVRSEVTVVAGDAGAGKSFLGMALALAVAGDAPEFLSQRVRRHGKVIYVDEEQSAQLAMQRLKGLGLTDQHIGNLEYIWYAGVDLLGEPEKLYEEAIEIEPELVIVDSLSRVAIGAEENSNDDMTRLLRHGLIPIARDTGAAVVVLHHTPDGNAAKPRGAGAIKAAADQVISLVKAQQRDGSLTGNINIFPSKPRRKTAHIEARIEGDLEADGWVRVERVVKEEPF